jgi:hypothetical protein
MKTTQDIKFKNVQVGDIVTYYSDLSGSISEAVVSEVNDKMFVLTTLSYWQKPDGVHSFSEKKMNFHKSGTKSHHRYTHGNAIEITSSVNIMGV